jgi:hypothetical protein
MTTIAELFQALGEPFPADQVKTRPGRGNTQLRWVPAAAVVARLNAVMPGQWEFESEVEGEDSVRGTLTLHLPGDIVRRYSQFGYANGAGSEEKRKEQSTDALRRCAAFGPGIGLELYAGAVAPAVAPRPVVAYTGPEPKELQARLISIVDELVQKHGDVETGSRIVAALSKAHVKSAADLPAETLNKWVAAATAKLETARAASKGVRA